MKKKKYNTFLVAGGTGGHIFPALSFSDFLKSKGVSNIIITDDRGSKYFNKSEPIIPRRGIKGTDLSVACS